MNAAMTIRIRDLELPVMLGVHPEERRAPRSVTLHLDIGIATADFTRAAQSDVLEDTIDYATLEQSIAHLLTTKTYSLLEHLCAEVAQLVLKDVKARSVRVEIFKSNALRHAPGVAMVYEITAPR